MEEKWFECAALNRRMPYMVNVPAGPPPAGGWPLVLVLHGRGRNHRALADAPGCVAELARRPMAWVFPAGEDGFYLDNPAVPGARYQSMLVELLAHARAVLPVSAHRRLTGIAGWSMGGFGAMRFAQDHPAAAGAVAAMIGLLDYPNPALPPEHNYHSIPQIFGESPAGWAAFNVTAQAEKLRGSRVLVIAARDDKLAQMSRNLHLRLRELGLAHQYLEMAGGHTLDVVKTALPMVGAFMQTAFDAAATSADLMAPVSKVKTLEFQN